MEELARVPPVLDLRAEIKDGVGANMVDPRTPSLPVVGDIARPGWVEPGLQAFHVTDAPGAALAMAP